MSRLAVIALTLVVASAPVLAPADSRPPIDTYLQARDRGLTGMVTGEAFAEATQPSGPPTPYGDVSVMLLPALPDFGAELNRIHAGLRDDARAYLSAAERLRTAREGLERDLAFAGGGELVLGEVTDAGGRFRFAGVPTGAWTLLAWREEPHAQSARHAPSRQLGAFVGVTQPAGFTTVAVWRVAVDVRPGEQATIRLNDRNIWLTVVREDKRTLEPKKTDGTGSKRRQGTTR
ncbi:MAG TPA: hypothetical protein VL948_17505 [Verrucomicrobiae bacterium]|jgi:hypothetical protein|nr:hypothetical protein [Verrucomicrobiae bacterium]